MAEKRQSRSSKARQFAAEADILAAGTARQRRMRRIGSSSERKPTPVVTPRPRRAREDATSARPHRERRVARTASSTEAIPVMARGGMESMAVRRRKGSQPKRRFDIALGSLVAEAPGAEVRLPALPRIHFSWRLLTIGILVMLLASLFMVWKSPAFHVSDVQVLGLQRLTLADLSPSLSVMGDSVFFVNSKELEQTLPLLFPELSSVDVSVDLPATVIINVVERQPVVAWTQDSTELWIDAAGVSFMPRGNPASALVRVKAQTAPPGSLPAQASVTDVALPGLLLSNAPQMRLDPRLVSAILSLSTVAPPDTLLLYNADYGLGWNDKVHGWKVFFGSETREIDQKLLVYQALAARLDADGIQPELVSVEYLHAPYYRMER